MPKYLRQNTSERYKKHYRHYTVFHN